MEAHRLQADPCWGLFEDEILRFDAVDPRPVEARDRRPPDRQTGGLRLLVEIQSDVNRGQIVEPKRVEEGGEKSVALRGAVRGLGAGPASLHGRNGARPVTTAAAQPPRVQSAMRAAEMEAVDVDRVEQLALRRVSPHRAFR